MSTRHFTLYWNKPNEEPRSRGMTFRVKIPVTEKTSAMEDALLQLPRNMLVDIGTHETEPTQDEAIAAIKASAAAEREKQEAQLEEKRNAVWAAYTAGPEDYANVTDPFGNPGYQIKEAVVGYPDLEQALTEIVEYRKAELARKRAERDARWQADRELQQQRKEQRQAEIEAYAASPAASDRLRLQIARGYEGWPLYLHEQVQRFFPGATLREDLEDEDAVSNPSEEQLAAEVAIEAVVQDNDVAIRNVRTVLAYQQAEPGAEYDYDKEPYTVWEFRPGSDAFNWYTVAKPFKG